MQRKTWLPVISKDAGDLVRSCYLDLDCLKLARQTDEWKSSTTKTKTFSWHRDPDSTTRKDIEVIESRSICTRWKIFIERNRLEHLQCLGHTWTLHQFVVFRKRERKKERERNREGQTTNVWQQNTSELSLSFAFFLSFKKCMFHVQLRT